MRRTRRAPFVPNRRVARVAEITNANLQCDKQARRIYLGSTATHPRIDNRKTRV